MRYRKKKRREPHLPFHPSARATRYDRGTCATAATLYDESAFRLLAAVDRTPDIARAPQSAERMGERRQGQGPRCVRRKRGRPAPESAPQGTLTDIHPQPSLHEPSQHGRRPALSSLRSQPLSPAFPESSGENPEHRFRAKAAHPAPSSQAPSFSVSCEMTGKARTDVARQSPRSPGPDSPSGRLFA